MTDKTAPAPRWISVADCIAESTDRMAVPGGWLYRCRVWAVDEEDMVMAHVPCTVALTFVPAAPAAEGE